MVKRIAIIPARGGSKRLIDKNILSIEVVDSLSEMIDICPEYGAEIYGEYASSKSLSVLIGTAIVMSLALVVTKALAKNSEDSKLLFVNSYYIIIRNFFITLLILFL